MTGTAGEGGLRSEIQFESCLWVLSSTTPELFIVFINFQSNWKRLFLLQLGDDFNDSRMNTQVLS